ncbi:TPA: integrating conjugative element membrane protein, partial [Klebsiella pneumoniae subsp. pneumoniae]|nr:integrating conjugative element membrane protein [Klebsiella pneumoniae subsp. pneumoniae]
VLPQFLTPEYFVVLSSVIVGLAVSFVIRTFKKYF